MKHILLIISITLAFTTYARSQNTIEDVLTEIERNNTTLSALRSNMKAQKLGNKTGVFLQNPELGFNYLWGSPSSMGNRKDISITQEFDFPSAYHFRSQISDLKNEQVELEYQKQLKLLILEARLISIKLIHANAMSIEFTKRVNHAETIAHSYEAKFKAGDCNILDYNKAQLNLLSIKKESETMEIKRAALLSDLVRLNGGKPISFSANVYVTPEMPADFEQWYKQSEQKNPILSWLKQEIEISQKQVKLNRAMSLPKIQAGYMSEKVTGEKFQGVTLGLSIPLWENKNSVKHANAKAKAIQEVQEDRKLHFFNRLKTLHTKAFQLKENVSNYRDNLKQFDNSELLKKALDQGEISLIDYILELSVYYESVNNLLELEKELNSTVAELNQYLL